MTVSSRHTVCASAGVDDNDGEELKTAPADLSPPEAVVTAISRRLRMATPMSDSPGSRPSGTVVTSYLTETRDLKLLFSTRVPSPARSSM